MSGMTVRERMLSVYGNRQTDRPALGIYQRYLPRGSAETESRSAGLGLINYYPAVTMMAPAWHFYEGYFSEVKNTEQRIQYYWQNGIRHERRSFITPVGTIYQESRLDAGGVGSEAISRHYISCMEDYDVLSYIVENTVFTSNRTAIRNMLEDLGEGGVVLGRLDRSPYQKCLIELAGAERFILDMYTEPERIEPLLELMGEKHLEAVKLSLDTPADVFWLPDNVTCDMTPPDVFSRFCLPLYRKMSDLIRQTEKPIFVHIDGKYRHLAGMISESGVDGVESVSIPSMGGDLTFAEARELLPDLVLIPNFPANLAESGEEQISSYVKQLTEENGGKPLMLQISEDIPAHSWKKVVPALLKELGY